MVLGRAAVLPAGLVSAAFLARVLGPADFGIYGVALSIIVWARMSIYMLLNRASIKLIAETPHWEPVAAALIQVQLVLGLTVGAAAFLAAPALADLLGEPELRPVFWVFSTVIPVSTLAKAYENTLNGCRAFRRSALVPVVSETTRLVLILILVGAGLGLKGAALAILGAAGVELWIVRRWVNLRLWQRVTIPHRQILRYSMPLFMDTLAKRLHGRMDLWAVQALAGSTAAGYYSVALSANHAGAVFSQALSPVILAAVSDAWAQGRQEAARAMIHQSLRLILWLTPFAALGAGAAPALVGLIFGEAYQPAAVLLAWVSFSIVALVIMSVTAAIFAAVGRPGAAFAFNGPLLILALAGYLLLVPRVGAIGAAATTALTAWGVAIATLVGVYHWCRVGPGRGTVLRVAVTSVVAYFLAGAWQAPGVWVVPQLLVYCGAVLALVYILGEVSRPDIDFVRSVLGRKPVPGGGEGSCEPTRPGRG
jgi:O-antigen/teichoic acid export membrane protein